MTAQPQSVNVVPCPCCKGELYRTTLIDDRGAWALGKGSPRVQSDELGPFMICPHCKKRVVLIPDRTAARAGLKLSDVQPCVSP
jgi:uncharacterized protein YbaR (Trm112 family)